MLTQNFSSFSCELKIIEAKNVESKTSGTLFVRCYLPGGSNNRRPIGVNTREIPTKNDHVWNHSFSLECFGTGDSMEMKQESLVLELRWRNRVSVIGTSSVWGSKSKLLGRTEIPWKEVVESPNMVLDKWVMMVNSSGVVKPTPAKLKVEIRARLWTENKETLILEKRRGRMGKNWDECGCKDNNHDHHGYGCEEYYDVFALAAALEAF